MNRALTGLTGLIVIAGGTCALAGPLNKAVVAKNAQWIVHVDAEACMASTIGRFITEHRAELDLADLDRVKQETGIDPLSDIKGVTVYGTGPDEHDGVAIVYTTAAVDAMVKKLTEKEESFKAITVGGYTLYSWTENGTSRFAQVRPDGAGRIVIVAADKDRLLAGIGVLEGKAEALTKAPTGLGAAAPRAGSIIFASATHLPDAEAMPFQHAEAFTLDAGESGQELYADMRVTAKSSEEAANMSQVARGGIALVKMGLGGDPEYREALQLLDGLTVVCDQKDVIGNIRVPSSKVGAALTALGQQIGKHHHKPLKGKDSKQQDAGDKD